MKYGLLGKYRNIREGTCMKCGSPASEEIVTVFDTETETLAERHHRPCSKGCPEDTVAYDRGIYVNVGFFSWQEKERSIAEAAHGLLLKRLGFSEFKRIVRDHS